jgi:hypothetical protein
MKTVTLFCENGQHEWTRASQRGRRPFHCPDHMPVKAIASEPREVVQNGYPTVHKAPVIDHELVDMFVTETKLSRRIVQAFILADLEPPRRERVDRTGFTFAELRIIGEDV